MEGFQKQKCRCRLRGRCTFAHSYTDKSWHTHYTCVLMPVLERASERACMRVQARLRERACARTCVFACPCVPVSVRESVGVYYTRAMVTFMLLWQSIPSSLVI